MKQTTESLVPISDSEWQGLAGAEPFADGSRPLIGEAGGMILTVDAHGVQIQYSPSRWEIEGDEECWDYELTDKEAAIALGEKVLGAGDAWKTMIGDFTNLFESSIRTRVGHTVKIEDKSGVVVSLDDAGQSVKMVVALEDGRFVSHCSSKVESGMSKYRSSRDEDIPNITVMIDHKFSDKKTCYVKGNFSSFHVDVTRTDLPEGFASFGDDEASNALAETMAVQIESIIRTAVYDIHKVLTDYTP